MEQSPVRGGMAPRKYLVSLVAGFLRMKPSAIPALSRWAIPQCGTALKGLAGANPGTLALAYL